MGINMDLTAREAYQHAKLEEASANLIRSIEQRLGLPPGSIGRTHDLDTVTLTVVARQPELGE